MVLIIVLICILVVLYWIIGSAIDSSKMAKDIKEIKELLKSSNPTQDDTILNRQEEKAYSEKNVEGIEEECPACNEKVLSTDEVCSSCGLTLNMNGDQ